MDKQALGSLGERQAEQFLIKKGFKILDRNFRTRYGEIDLVALDPKTLEYVFVEVKYRKSLAFGYPEESITPAKLKKMRSVANAWLLHDNRGDAPWRLDAIAILEQKGKTEIIHLENLTL